MGNACEKDGRTHYVGMCESLYLVKTSRGDPKSWIDFATMSVTPSLNRPSLLAIAMTVARHSEKYENTYSKNNHRAVLRMLSCTNTYGTNRLLKEQSKNGFIVGHTVHTEDAITHS